MLLRFYKNTYSNNTYKLTDFFTSGVPGNWKIESNKTLNLNIQASDGMTSVVVPTRTLPDNSDVQDYTHVYAEDEAKCYEIIKFEYINNKQLRLILEEDALLSNMAEWYTQYMLVSRTNDTDYFRGVVDINDIAVKKKTSIVDSVKSPAGPVALVFLQPNDLNTYKLKFQAGIEKRISDVEDRGYGTLVQLEEAYPDITTSNPEREPLAWKFAMVGLDSYQFIYVDGKLQWVKVVRPDTEYELVLDTTTGIVIDRPDVRLNKSSIDAVIVAIPLSRWESFRADPVADRTLLFQDFVGPGEGTTILGVKIVDSSLVGVSNLTYNPYTLPDTLKDGAVDMTLDTSIAVLANNPSAGVVRDSAILYALRIPEVSIDYSLTLVPTNYLPFKRYLLDVYGNKHEINPRYADDLNISFSVAPQQISYAIWYKNKQTIIATGVVNSDAQYSIDNLDLFYTNNPTYKDQFQAGIWQNAIKSVGFGAVGGAVQGGPAGAAAGAATGALNAGVDTAFAMYNEKLRQEGLRLQPDTIQGNDSEVGLNLTRQYGIFLYVETADDVDGDELGYEHMLLEYQFKGYPTQIRQKPETLNFVNGTLTGLGNMKVIKGQIINTIKNPFDTKKINTKLQQGIILVQ